MSRKRKHVSETSVAETDTCPTRESREKDRRLYCICKSRDDPSKLMLHCDLCDDWFHPVCVGLDDGEAEVISKWFCPGCFEVMSMNPTISQKGMLAFQGRVAPTTGWCDNSPIREIDESVIVHNVTTKRHRIEGWNLFREGRVIGLSSNELHDLMYFRGQCQAAMRQQSYNVYVCLKDGGAKLKWATCSCPAGIDGQCKHVVATLYSLIDLHRQDVFSIPDVKTCTDKLQMWHVRKPVSDEPILFSDIQFVKHEPEKQSKKDLCSVVRNHDPIPDFARSVTTQNISNLVALYDASGIKLPVLETIRDNSCIPVSRKQYSDVELQDELFEVMRGQPEFNDLAINEIIDSGAKQHYKGCVDVDYQTASIIEKQTRLQSRNSFWFEQREYRLTSSMFGTFCRLKETTNAVNTFTQKKKFFTTRSVRHGINYESQAFARYLQDRQCTNCPVGLIVNPSVPYLAASPDRLVKVGNQLR